MNRKQCFIIADWLVNLESRHWKSFDSQLYVKKRERIIENLMEAQSLG